LGKGDERFGEAEVLFRLGELAGAQRLLRKLLAKEPARFDALWLLGAVLLEAGDPGEATKILTRAARLRPNDAALAATLANALSACGRKEEALDALARALDFAPDFHDARLDRSWLLREMHRGDEALHEIDIVLGRTPDFPPAHHAKVETLLALGRRDAAIAALDAAAATGADNAGLLCARARLLAEAGRPEAAVEDWTRALALDPALPTARIDRGRALFTLGRLGEALADFDAAAGDSDLLFEIRGFIRRQMADWSWLDAERAALDRALAKGAPIANAFPILSISNSHAVNAAAARAMIHSLAIEAAPPLPARIASGKIRIGYFSADFHDHATAHLLTRALELHDKASFETIGFSFGPDRDDAYRNRLRNAFDDFLDIRTLSDNDAAALARARGLDIAVDLKGLTEGARPGIFLRRAAPVQVNYLGWPGSMGHAAWDYLIADSTVLFIGGETEFAEKIVRLPCYQPADSARPVSQRAYTREDSGLPPTGVVYACFNNSYKILPDIFERWMRILRAVQGSVLWLIEDNPDAVRNLRAEAARRDIAPERLVFAPRLPIAEHLARHRLADLFLDTLPYGAHTTARDALSVGTPVLTVYGETFPGRVAASLLTDASLFDLVVHDLDAYERLAIDLGRDPARLANISARMRAAPQFDPERRIRNLEMAYRRMQERSARGLPADHIWIAGNE